MPSENRHINLLNARSRACQKVQAVLGSLEELVDSPEFHEFVAREVPAARGEWTRPSSGELF